MKLLKYFKYFYIIFVLCGSFSILILRNFINPLDIWLITHQEKLFKLIEDSNGFYSLIFFLFILFLKSCGIKDPFGFLLISLIIVVNYLTTNIYGLFFISYLFLILSSTITKFLQYKFVGEEIKNILGVGFNSIIKIKCFFTYFFTDETLDFLDTKYLKKISQKSFKNKDMNIINNFLVTTDYDNHTYYLFYFYSIILTMLMEISKPFNEMYLYTHNLSITKNNVFITICAEIIDIDKILELYITVVSIKNQDILNMKMYIIYFKILIYIVGNILIIYPILKWSKVYCNYHKL